MSNNNNSNSLQSKRDTKQVEVVGAAAASRPVLDIEEEKEEAIGVKVLHNAPDYRLANLNLGK